METIALVIHPFLKAERVKGRSIASRLEEVVGLAGAIDLNVRLQEAVSITRINAGTYFGKGTVERIRKLVAEYQIEVVCIDTNISPVQQRSLEKTIDAKVIDRTGLILEIFGERAVTKEGVLQVELAHLKYQRSRLVRTWTHLERQRGGVGFLGGPGETQIEADRRIISDRIGKIEKELQTVRRTRKLHRRARGRVPYPIVALVGYTNAGKSSLFNTLTNSKELAKDLLFATLDPKMRQLKLPSRRSIILSDTVGFVSELPTMLIASFRATLEEVIAADVIIHVRDISHPDTEAQKQDVLKVLDELGVDVTDELKFIEVLNKTDLLETDDLLRIQNIAMRNKKVVPLSAKTGENADWLIREVDELLALERTVVTLKLPYAEGKGIAWLYRNAEVLERKDLLDCAEFRVLMFSQELAQFQKNFNNL
ncbi:MAG: GTPase HflX [Pseudomonadota bacterium]|nr:GTPase HflX [Pseudomonadota bacterium]